MDSGRPLRSRGAVSAGLLVLVTILAALGWILSREALRGLPPLTFIGIRFVMAGMVLSLPAGPRLRHLPARDFGRAALTGLVLGLSMASWIEGLHFADNLGVGAFISSLGNILAPIVGWALFGWRIAGSTWGAVAVATAGLACLSLGRGLSLSTADLFFLGSALGSALNLNFNTRFASRIPILSLTAVQMYVVGVVGLVFACFCETWTGMPNWETIGWLVASVLIPTSLRFALQVFAQSLAPISQTALLLTLEPVWTAFIAIFWLGTAMSPAQGIGCVLIFLALLVNRWPSLVGTLLRRS